MPSLIKVAEFAKDIGISRKSVYKANKRNAIQINNGLIDLIAQHTIEYIQSIRIKKQILQVAEITKRELKEESSKYLPSSIRESINKDSIGNSKTEILDNLKKFDINERYTFFSDGTLSFMDIFLALLDNRPKAKIILSTWQLGVNNVEILHRTSKIHDLKILLDVSFKSRCVSAFEEIKEKIGNHVWFSKNHSKVLLISQGKKNITVLSSANFNKNTRLEFFDITDDKKLFDLTEKAIVPFFRHEPIKTDKRCRSEINSQFGDEPIFSQDQENISKNEIAFFSQENASKTKQDYERDRVYKQNRDLDLKFRKARDELLERKDVQMAFSKLYSIQVSKLHGLSHLVIPEIAVAFKSTNSEMMFKATDAIDGAIFSALEEIKKIMNDYLVSVKAEEIEDVE